MRTIRIIVALVARVPHGLEVLGDGERLVWPRGFGTAVRQRLQMIFWNIFVAPEHYILTGRVTLSLRPNSVRPFNIAHATIACSIMRPARIQMGEFRRHCAVSALRRRRGLRRVLRRVLLPAGRFSCVSLFLLSVVVRIRTTEEARAEGDKAWAGRSK